MWRGSLGGSRTRMGGRARVALGVGNIVLNLLVESLSRISDYSQKDKEFDGRGRYISSEIDYTTVRRK